MSSTDGKNPAVLALPGQNIYRARHRHQLPIIGHDITCLAVPLIRMSSQDQHNTTLLYLGNPVPKEPAELGSVTVVPTNKFQPRSTSHSSQVTTGRIRVPVLIGSLHRGISLCIQRILKQTVTHVVVQECTAVITVFKTNNLSPLVLSNYFR